MNDIFNGLGGLMKGLSGFMPQDDPDVKLMSAQSELSDLQMQEIELYAEIGKQALAREKGQFPALEAKLDLIQTNLQEVSQKLQSAQSEKEAKEAARQAEEAAHTCLACGNLNPDGVKFCQECGAKLGVLKCVRCGAPLSPGIRFCGECGARQG